jgi:hypothetical protein
VDNADLEGMLSKKNMMIAKEDTKDEEDTKEVHTKEDTKEEDTKEDKVI